MRKKQPEAENTSSVVQAEPPGNTCASYLCQKASLALSCTQVPVEPSYSGKCRKGEKPTSQQQRKSMPAT